MNIRRHFIPIALCLLVAGACNAQTGTGADHDHAHAERHAHAHPSADSGTSAPPAGGWPSDAPLRQGMQAILEAVKLSLGPSGDGKALAAELRNQVDFLFANCKLEVEADAALHRIIADLLHSAKRLESGATPTEEHDALHAALVRYGDLFAHPGWPLR